MKQHLLSFSQSTTEQISELLQLALKVKQQPEDYKHALAGKSFVALFEKPSLRTRVSLEIGINKLGGHLVYLDSQKDKLSGREDTKDMAANLSCWADGIIARVFSHQTLLQLSQYASVPVVNALCDLYHPCQALADYLTLHEVLGNINQVKLAYIGDGNNVCHSLMVVGAILGADIRVITPEGHEPDPETCASALNLAKQNDGVLRVSNDLSLAEGVDALYTDTWLSMGNETSLQQILPLFKPYQLNTELMQQTGAKYVMHCQPAHREQEITSELMDGPCSLLMRQAENRMYAQAAILIKLLQTGE